MRSPTRILALMALAAAPVLAQSSDKVQERLDQSAVVLDELVNAPDAGIPKGLIENARCVGIVPSVKKAAFGFGGEYGRGVAVCRTSTGGPWGPPSMMAMEGGSFGFQIGGSAMDVVMFFMNDSGMDKLLKDKFTLGGDATVAAGPVGRNTQATTDVLLQAEILTWARSKGVFAGVSLKGATFRPDNDANEALYGRKIEPRAILTGDTVEIPVAATGLIDELYSID